MPWQESSRMSERQEFVALAQQEAVSLTELCQRFGISRKTGYKWLSRVGTDPMLGDRSRRPHTTPRRTAPEVEAAVVALRQEHPRWGGRKLHHALARQGMVQPPMPSTITGILRRHGLLAADPPRRPGVRFEHPASNDLWQLDFMGHRALDADRVHPLTLLDDHSRFALALAACADQQHATVKERLTAVFRRYGVPRVILTDNGAPWRAAGEEPGLTRLEAWWLQLGIAPWHGRPRHPQTQGKVERFHRTIAAEVFAQRQFPDLPLAQAAFDAFRTTYNQARPHEALAFAVPAERYQPSPRPFPEVLPEIVYGPDDTVRMVTKPGSISWQGQRIFVSRAIVGLPVGVRPTADDGVWHVVFCHRHVATIDQRFPKEV